MRPACSNFCARPRSNASCTLRDCIIFLHKSVYFRAPSQVANVEHFHCESVLVHAESYRNITYTHTPCATCELNQPVFSALQIKTTNSLPAIVQGSNVISPLSLKYKRASLWSCMGELCIYTCAARLLQSHITIIAHSPPIY